MKRHTILHEICLEKKEEEENMNRGKNLIQLVLVGILSLMLVSCGTPPTRDNGDSSLVSDCLPVHLQKRLYPPKR